MRRRSGHDLAADPARARMQKYDVSYGSDLCNTLATVFTFCTCAGDLPDGLLTGG